jgi:hypothetical protein
MSQNKCLNEISEILKSNKSVIQMSYDTVKAHGREIKLEIIDGEGTTFRVSLPVNN